MTDIFKMLLQIVCRNFFNYIHDIPNFSLIIYIFLTIFLWVFFWTHVYTFTLILWNNLILSDLFQLLDDGTFIGGCNFLFLDE